MASIPLFPLRAVLFPGARLPLRIFEPRYLALVETLVRSDTPPVFGVIAIRAGAEIGDPHPDLHDIGCLAQVRRVEPASGPTAGYHLEAEGTRRFRLLGTDHDAGTPYLTGEVSWLAEPRGGSPEQLAALADHVRERLGGWRVAMADLQPETRFAPETGFPTDPTRLSYAVIAHLVLPLAQRQAVLAAESTAARLRADLILLRRELWLLRRFRAVPKAHPTLKMSPN